MSRGSDLLDDRERRLFESIAGFQGDREDPDPYDPEHEGRERMSSRQRKALPTTKRQPIIDIRSLNTLVYGVPKVGKSTLASQCPDPLFISTEDGVKTLSVMEYKAQDWNDIEDAISQLSDYANDPDRPWKTVVIDTIDNLLLYAKDDVCKELGIDDPSDAGYGKGFNKVNERILSCLNRITQLSDKDGFPAYGLWMISHEKQQEQESRKKKWMKAIPTMSESQRKIVEGFADLILYATAEKDHETEKYKRVLKTKPSPFYIAGDRTNFLPDTIEMSLDSPTTYEKLDQAILQGAGAKPTIDGDSKSKGKAKAKPKQEEEKPSPPIETPSKEEDPVEAPQDAKQDTVPNGIPRWAIQAWDTLDELDEGDEDKREFLTSKLKMILQDEEAVWSRQWLSENEDSINEIHQRFIIREAEKKAKGGLS